MKVYIHPKITQDQRERLEQARLAGEDWFWGYEMSDTEKQAALATVDIVFGNPPVNWLEAGSELQWVQLTSAGIDPYDQSTLSRKPTVRFTNLRNFFGVPVAESVMAGILTFYRKIIDLARAQEQQQWIGSEFRPQMQLLSRKRVLLLGSGAIGKAIAGFLAAFSCQVQLVNRSSEIKLNEIQNILPQQDIVIACLPDTPETQQVFNSKMFDAMKPTALLVNVGRGSLINEKDLLKALQDKVIAGAVLDVTEEEPLPEAHPFWNEPNLLLTQHIAGGYAAEVDDKIDVFLQNLQRFRNNVPLENAVDFGKGY